jgi:isoquinoline 1-oxidoreductase alpha subunit
VFGDAEHRENLRSADAAGFEIDGLPRAYSVRYVCMNHTNSSPYEVAMAFTIKVNGATRSVDVDGDTPLLWVLRDAIGLTGTKYGCGVAQCGACTVLLDGKPLRSCTLPVSALGTAEVTTIEGVTGREARAVQGAWVARDVPQCGFCQSGQVMSAIALLRAVKKPSDRDIDLAMNGNICRCATYVRIRAAIKDAARALEG